jgi:hypothetical protein
MSEQPVVEEQVYKAQVIIDIYNTHTDSEVTMRMDGVTYRDIAKQVYAVARHFEKLHRDSRKKPVKPKPPKPEPEQEIKERVAEAEWRAEVQPDE